MLIPDGVAFGDADLTNCDREAIHIPGSIQPHGVLLVVDRHDLSIEQTAGDTKLLLGIDPERLIGQGLSALLDRDTLAFVVAHLDMRAVRIAPVVRLGIVPRSGAITQDLTVSAQGRTVLVEFEPARRAPTSSGDPIAQLKVLLSSLAETSTLDECCAAAAIALRAATGFDRAMVYRFQPDETGVVIAEDLEAGLVPYLGLHYPASDIPKQARELYLRQWLRAIPDTHYVAAVLRPARNGRSAGPIDMSDCGLRSVSPIHLQYMRNMGIAGSLSMSVVCNGGLWGLLVLHNQATPRYVAADLRVACETFAQVFSLQIEAKTLLEQSIRRITARGIREAVVARLSGAADVGEELASRELLRYVDATGVAAFVSGKLHTFGFVPGDAHLVLLMQWLDGIDRLVFSTDCLAAAYPAAAEFADRVSGLLAVALTRTSRDYVLWFRAEYEITVSWAGDPSKAVMVGDHGGRLTPRESFAEWRELMRRHSAPWSDIELEAADALRINLLENVLTAADRALRDREAAYQRLRATNLQLERSNRDLEDFAYIASHDLKAPLNGIDSTALCLEEDLRDTLSDESRKLLELMRSRINRMNVLLDDLLTYSRIGRTDPSVGDTQLADIFPNIIGLLRPPAHVRIRVEVEPAVIVTAGQQLEQVLRNLISNAIKHHDKPSGEVIVSAERTGDFVQFVVRDDGPGIAPQFHEKIFQLFQTLKRRDDVEGTGMGLAIVKKLIERQNCQIMVHSEGDGRGTEFRFQWPASQPAADAKETSHA